MPTYTVQDRYEKMADIKLQSTTFQGRDGNTIRLEYEDATDTLEIFFGANLAATGIELTEHILLRVSREEARAVSLLIRHFSILTEQTEFGTRSFSLENLDALPEDLRSLTLQLIRTPPVNQFLKLSHLQPTSAEARPLIFVEPHPIAAHV